MRIRRSQRKAPARRPRKKAGDRRRRVATQKKRLVALGVAEEALKKMSDAELRALLRHPEKTAAVCAAGK